MLQKKGNFWIEPAKNILSAAKAVLILLALCEG
jgi:hypothetical protein